MSNPRGDLVAKISKAVTFSEQAQFVSDLDDYDQNLRSQAAASRELDLAGAVVTQTLTPVLVHEMHTAATDWIGDFEPDAGLDAHASIAEAAMWFGRVSPEVKADIEEFGIQAEGFMRIEASRHGNDALAVYNEGLAYLGFLHRRQAASGLDQIQQTVNPHEDPAPTPLPEDVFDNFAPAVAPINDAAVGSETSQRAPLIQEIEQSAGGSAAPEKPGGHSTSEDVSGGYSEVPAGGPEDNSSGPVGLEGWGGGSAEPEQPDEHNDDGAQEDDLERTSSWDSRSVALSHTMNMDQFREMQAKEAASGLDQIQQTVDPHDSPSVTPLPVEVMFPWLIGPDAYGTQGAEPEGEVGQGPADVANSPNPYQGRRKQAEGNHAPCPNHEGQWFNKSTGACSCGSSHSQGDKTATRKQADMFGNSDMPHQVPGPSPANTPNTKANERSGYQQGFADAQRGDHPTFADASSGAPTNVQQYTKGYSDGVNAQGQGQGGGMPPQDVPVSLGGDNGQNVGNGGDLTSTIDNLSAAASRVSSRFVKAASRTNPDFRKGYGFASQWEPGKPLVTMGSAEFEAGVFAGLIDRPQSQEAWVQAHRRQARKDKRFARRMTTYSRYMEHLASVGISVEAGEGVDECKYCGTQNPGISHKCPTGTPIPGAGKQGDPYTQNPNTGRGILPSTGRRKQAGTSTDLDTTDLTTSPSLTGQTPINGRGQEGPLAGQQDPAAPGGPAPYNGAEPFGHQVVPSGPTSSGHGSEYVNDIPGGPADGNVNPATVAFRRKVQSSLLAANKKG